jgi:hypothetical protein
LPSVLALAYSSYVLSLNTRLSPGLTSPFAGVNQDLDISTFAAASSLTVMDVSSVERLNVPV